MTDRKLYDLGMELSSLSVFRGVLSASPLEALRRVLLAEKKEEQAWLLGEFVRGLIPYGGSLADLLRDLVFTDENAVIKAAAAGEELPPAVHANAARELALFSRLAGLSQGDFAGTGDPASAWVPYFEGAQVDFAAEYARRLKDVSKYGYGIFAKARMFKLAGEDRDVRIVPVESPDPVSLDKFIGYQEERLTVLENCEALLSGRPAANMLLFGDAGTGKSSTIKACVNKLAGEGLRLIELRKDQLLHLPYVMGRISGNPLKFIIFIDDLSFAKQDSSFSMLKAALEGSASAKAPNAVIYATSNRRHIVRESFAERTGMDEVHINDTMQELMSLSDRFGKTVYFEKPNKKLYLEIVNTLAARAGLEMDPAELAAKAESYALRKGSRSPRAAEQFVEGLL